MKRNFTLLLMLLYAFTGYAQEEEVAGPRSLRQNHNLFSGLDAPNSGIGIKGGVNFANVHGSDKDLYGGNVNSYTSFHAGIFAQFSLGQIFSIQPEILYSRKGFEQADSTFRFDYLDLPLLAVFNFTDNFSIHAGPQIGIMVSSKQGDREIDLAPYNTFDYGFAAGLEGRVSRFRVGARYNMSFADLRKENDTGQSIDQDIMNSVIQVYLGIGF
ncbi:porin family protein [Pontibacter silvestris]|uniref:Porin family protein n=1 Tax=Pontibacter silvestris TaxID=2305183 RepID=A0ABW4WT75_9BACT|nr:porin family protein [Pontibacter silvestris]MCC9138760.1 PorT family protein [Pontibacter silvestris]